MKCCQHFKADINSIAKANIVTTGYRHIHCLSAYTYVGAPIRQSQMPHLEASHCKKMWHTFDAQSFLECVISGLCVIILMYPHGISLSDICSSSCSTESVDHPCLGIIHVACRCEALENMHGIAHILKVKYRFFKM